MDQFAGESFHTLLSRVVSKRSQEMRIENPELARRLGANYRMFMYWLRGKYSFPAELLPELCRTLGSYELLDALEQRVGRVAYLPPTATDPVESDLVSDIQRFVKETGDALHVLAVTLRRKTLTEREFSQSIAELDDVIRECALIKYKLGTRRVANPDRGKGSR